jgi:peptide/nickel transport system substrate-binding protein
MRALSLQQNEVDYLEYAPVDNLPRMRANRNIVISQASGQAEMMYAVSINHHQAPFNNVLVRRALQQCLDRGEILAATGFAEIGRPECAAMLMCGTTLSSTLGSEAIATPSLERARALLREAGYNNERVVLMHPTDSALLNPFGLVLIDRMKRAGFNVDVQASDWSSIAQRWVQRAPLDRGGWSVLPVVYTGFDMADPLSNMGIGFNCTDNQPWGYCEASMTPILERFEAESDPERRRALAAELNREAVAQATFLEKLFTCMSAFCTVGLDVGVTATLGRWGQLVLIVGMFVGRIGILLLLSAIYARRLPSRVGYPQEEVFL